MADDEEDWQWVHSPRQHPIHDSPRCEDEHQSYGWHSGRGDRATTPTWAAAPIVSSSENASSTASSPIFRHHLIATVMAKEDASALDAVHLSITEWMEPQLVFTRPHGRAIEGCDIFKIIAHFQKLPKAKEAFLSLLSDPVVCNAVMSNKAFQELAYECTDDSDDGDGSDDHKSESACSTVSLRKACKLLKVRLMEAMDILLASVGAHPFRKSAVDELDSTARSCILLVAFLIFVVIGKRSEEGAILMPSW